MKRKRPNFFLHLHPPKIPKREGSFFYTFGLGGISVFLVLILGITGLLEVFYYIPSAADANRSLQMITYLVPYGNLVRGIHYWAGQLLIVTAILHMVRVVLTGSYKSKRSFNWLLGVFLLVIVLLFNFTGYALRWDKNIAWALLVGTNLLKTIPWIGETIYQLAVGSSSIGDQTIVRFYGWHIYGFAIIAVILVVWHIFRVRRDGGISARLSEGPTPKITRNTLLEKEVVGMFVVGILLIALTLIFPPSLGGPADLNNIPEDATAPWFFIWIQQLLRVGDPLLLGVLVPLLLLVLLIIVPYLLDRSESGVGVWFNKEGRLAQIAVIFVIASILTLTLIRVL